MSDVTWNGSGGVATPSPFAPLLGWLRLLGVLLVPPALLVLPLTVVWKPSPRPAWRLLALLVAALTAAAWWWWATRWHGGLQAVLVAYEVRYVQTVLAAREAVLTTGAPPPGAFWLDAVRATWPVWVPVGLVLAALHASLGTAADDRTDGGGGGRRLSRGRRGPAPAGVPGAHPPGRGAAQPPPGLRDLRAACVAGPW